MKLKDELLKLIRSVVNPLGYDIVKISASNPFHLIVNQLRLNNITVVLDVGANAGQYSMELRKAGYRDQIISFEPLSDAYRSLSANSSRDKDWNVYNYALGETERMATINVSAHSPSSSFLPMTDTHRNAAPGSDYIKEERIEIKTLDAVYNSLGIEGEKVFMKVDTQGYEKKVIDGAAKSLSEIKGIQLELSATKLYDGEENYYTMCSFMDDKNFRLVRVIPGFTDKKNGEMLQFDAIFIKND